MLACDALSRRLPSMKKSYKISPAIGATERRLGKHCGLEHATAATAGSQRQLEDPGTLKNKKTEGEYLTLKKHLFDICFDALEN